MVESFFGLGTAWSVGAFLVGLAVARLAIATARTPTGSVAWVVFLVSFPVLAIPVYLVFGGVARLKGRGGAEEPETDIETRRAAAEAEGPDKLGAIIANPFEEGNAARLLIDGEATFAAIGAAIDAAEREVLVQFYVLGADRVGHELGLRMKAAAARGVRVCLLCDLLGSFNLPRAYVEDLRENGVEVRGFRGRGAVWAVRPNFRNHRKTVVVDERVGFTGGVNADMLHVTGRERFDSWRDTFVRLEGPVVSQLRTVIENDWNAFGKPDLPPGPGRAAPVGDRRVAIAATGISDGLERGSLLLCGLVGLARRRLWITTPYLVPQVDLLSAIQLAALRGVDVRIALPLQSDSMLAWYAGRSYFDDLHAAGVTLYEYLPGFMHQKVMLIDDDLASVGTMNLDVRSALLNYEETALVHDAGFAAEVEAMLEADFARCRNAADRAPSRATRFLAPIGRLFAPLL